MYDIANEKQIRLFEMLAPLFFSIHLCSITIKRYGNEDHLVNDDTRNIRQMMGGRHGIIFDFMGGHVLYKK